MTTNFAQSERRALSDLFAEVGPDAPTLCEGWTSADLAAHLVVRERRPDTGPGIVVKQLQGWTERVRRSTRESTPYGDLVAQVRTGPPVWSPIRLVPGLDVLTNTVEFFVHHEDVRRAQPGWEPRDLPDEMEAALWRRLGGSARVMFRSAPVSLTLETDAGERVVAKGDGSDVTVTGKPSELTLLGFGRAPQIRVQAQGAPDDVAAVLGASYGI